MSDSDEDNIVSEQTSTTTASFLVAFYINFSISVSLFAFFLYCRRRRPDVFSPRSLLCEKKPPPLRDTYFDWMIQFFQIDDGEIFTHCGLDALMCIKTFRLGFYFAVLCCPVGFWVLIPLNATASSQIQDNGNSSLTAGFDTMSIGNIPDTDVSRFLGPTLACYLFCSIMMIMLYKQNLEFIDLRIRHNKADHLEAYSIMVKGIHPDDSTDEKFYKLFDFVYPGKVASARVIRNTEKLDTLVDKRNGFRDEMEEELIDFAKNGDGKAYRKVTKSGFCGLYGRKIRKMNLLVEKFEKYKQLVVEERGDDRHFETQNISCHVGFVTFNNLTTASLAVQSLHNKYEYNLCVQPAPEPRDVYWQNINIPPVHQKIRMLIGNCVTGVLVLVWAIPVVLVQGLVSIENLSKYWPALSVFLDKQPLIKGFVEGFLPTLVVTLFMEIVPPVCYLISVFQGIEARSWLDIATIKKVFYFQFINVFLISTFAGTLLTSLYDLVNNPTGIFSTLGTSLPKVATFFIDYVMLLAFGSFFLQLSMVIDMIIMSIKLKWFATTPRAIEEAKKPSDPDYSAVYPEAMLVFALTLTYSTISPLILIFAAAYFFIGWMVLKYQALYIFMPEFQSGGLQWPIAFKYITIAMSVYQFTMIGMLLLKKSFVSSILIPLPIITYLFYKSQSYLIVRAGRYIPVTIAAEIDYTRLLPEDGEDVTCLNHETKDYYQPNTLEEDEIDVLPQKETIEAYEARLELLGYIQSNDDYANSIDNSSDDFNNCNSNIYGNTEGYVHDIGDSQNDLVCVETADVDISYGTEDEMMPYEKDAIEMSKKIIDSSKKTLDNEDFGRSNQNDNDQDDTSFYYRFIGRLDPSFNYTKNALTVY